MHLAQTQMWGQTLDRLQVVQIKTKHYFDPGASGWGRQMGSRAMTTEGEPQGWDNIRGLDKQLRGAL